MNRCILSLGVTLFGFGIGLAEAQTAEAIRPFRVRVPDADVADLRRRLAATRWPDKETVVDQSQGAQLAKLQELVRYWGTDYDWRKAEAKLNAFPQFKTKIDGVDIHFIHVRSRHPNALPVIITHGWPGSVVEQGGDWGAGVVQAMGRQAPAGLLGIHTNFPATVPPEVSAALAGGGPAPAGLSQQERAVFDALRTYGQMGNRAYLAMMSARPQAGGYLVAESPGGLAAFMLGP